MKARIASLVFLLVIPVGLLAAADSEVTRRERGQLIIEDIPEIPERIHQRLHQYQNTRAAGFQGWHPSGDGILISTRFGETAQIHWVRSPGGARHQVTFFDEPVGGAAINPNPEIGGFLFTRDAGGSEFFQLSYFDLETGQHRLLSDGSSRNGSPSWSPDGRRYAYHTTRRNGTDWDIWVGDIVSGKERPVLEKGGAWLSGEWSPDGSQLLVMRLVSANESHPFLLDLASGELTALADSEEKIAYGAAEYAKDGRGIYFTSDERSDFKRLRYYDVEAGEARVLSGDVGWDIESIALSQDGEYLAYSVNEGGISRLTLKQLDGWRDRPLPELPPGRIGSIEFSPDGTRLGFQINTSSSPGDVYAVDLKRQALERWTHSEVGGLSTDFVDPQLIHYPTFDQVDGQPRQIPAFYYRPAGPGPFPVLIQIHGGPEGQVRPTFNALRQYLLRELKIAVLTPNVRGSTGYGKAYLKLDNGRLREDSVKDIGKLLDWIAEQPELDADRVAVTGGSYGGYMTLASMVHFNDRLRAGIDVVGISNFVTFLENTQDYRRDLRRVEYGDERDPEMRQFLTAISPTTHATKITKPLLIVQGLNDPRVPASESSQMVEVIRQNGGEVWYLLAKDEGHGFRKKTNRDYYQSAMVLFLERFLGT